MDFNGKPLIDWTIEFAKTLGYPIYVSTDLRDFKRDGVKTIVRPAFINQDIDMKFVVEHAITKISEPAIILLQCTTPKRSEFLIKRYIKVFEEFKKNVVTVNMYTNQPNGYCFIFPKNHYIWDYPIFVMGMNEIDTMDIDYIWDFRIAEAIQRGDHR